MSHNSFEKRIEALEHKIVPDELKSRIEDAFLEILSGDELGLLERAIHFRKSGASEEDAYAVLGDAKPEIDRKCELATDVVLHNARLDEYNQLKQEIEDSLYGRGA
jgi:hypothetical protein